MGGGEKVKKLDTVLLPRKTFGYCSLLLSWDIMSLHAILQAFPVIVSYREFPLKSVACNSMAGYGCKGSEFYPNVKSQMTAKSSLSQVMTPLKLNVLWKKIRKTWRYKTPSPDPPCCCSTARESQMKCLQPSRSSSNVQNLKRRKQALSLYRQNFFDAKIPVPAFPRPNQSLLPYLLYVTDIWQRKPHGLLNDVTVIKFFTPLGCLWFVFYSQHFIAGSLLPAKVWFNGSSHHLNLILRWSASCLTEIKVVSTHIFSVLNSCESLTMRCRAAIKK